MFYVGMIFLNTANPYMTMNTDLLSKNKTEAKKGNSVEKENLKTENKSLAQPEKDEFKRMTKSQIKDILVTPQVARSDCYLVSTLKALAKSGFGKKILKNCITLNSDKTAYNVNFKKYQNEGEKASYTVNNGEKYLETTGKFSLNPIGAVEVASSDLLNDRKDAKPWYLRVFGYDTNLEGNLASVFMKNLTGKDPISLNDNSPFSLSFKNKKNAKELLDKIGNLPIDKHSFVAGSVISEPELDSIKAKHYYVIKDVDNKKKEVHLMNPRYINFSNEKVVQEFEKIIDNDIRKYDISERAVEQEKRILRKELKEMPRVITLSDDDFIDNFRSIVGYMQEKVK